MGGFCGLDGFDRFVRCQGLRACRHYGLKHGRRGGINCSLQFDWRLQTFERVVHAGLWAQPADGAQQLEQTVFNGGAHTQLQRLLIFGAHVDVEQLGAKEAEDTGPHFGAGDLFLHADGLDHHQAARVNNAQVHAHIHGEGADFGTNG